MKYLFSTIALVCVALPALAQTTAELQSIDPLYRYELYRPYPAERIRPQTAAPNGYKPFYISHLGRHGSRWHVTAEWYEPMLDLLREADQKGLLTDTGKRLYDDWQKVAADARGHYGELSPAGVAEQRGIARRMCESFPEVFSTKGGKTCKVDCRSTMVPRCIMSMASFAQEFSRHCPKVDVTMSASECHANYLAVYGDLNDIQTESRPLSDSVRLHHIPDTKNFVNRLFKNSGEGLPEYAQSKKFMLDMFLGAAILQATDHVGVELFDYIFTEEEMNALWASSNMRRYILSGPSVQFWQYVKRGARGMIRNIIETADRAIATGDEQVTLRFAHDVTIMPMVAILGIEYGRDETDDFDNLYNKWQSNVVTPMAANIQLIFYRNKANDVLVKVLHCENEQILSPKVATPVEGCYYRWSDLRAYLQTHL